MTRSLVARPLILAALLVPLGTIAADRASAQTTGDHPYRVLLLRAAPGHLTELIDLFEARRVVQAEAEEEGPLILRHSQGDHWDLMLMWPIGSLESYFSTRRAERLAAAAERVGAPDDTEFERRLRELTAWRQEQFVAGVSPESFREAAAGAGLGHVEMFVALPGKYDELLRQRDMEGEYLEATGRRANLVFTRLAGSEWDLFTLGFYPDMLAFATEPDLPLEEFEAAARDAGFASRGAIGTYLRSLIDYHNDTLAVVVE